MMNSRACVKDSLDAVPKLRSGSQRLARDGADLNPTSGLFTARDEFLDRFSIGSMTDVDSHYFGMPRSAPVGANG